MSKTLLQYGESGIEIEIPSNNVNVIRPRFVPGLDDEASGFREAVTRPINSKPLAELISAEDKVVVVIPDSTRPCPSYRLLPWLFEALPHVPKEQFVILNGVGTHRANTPAELEAMVGKSILENYRVVNHNASDPDVLGVAGHLKDGRPVYLNKEYIEADKRIIVGFIEPHFMAGFSGGYKATFPGIAGLESIMHYHRATVLQDVRSTWAVTEGNPTQDQVRANGSILPVDFCVNVTLNLKHEITRFFCGETLAAHAEGCSYVKESAMVACPQAYPLVITTNSGAPLDQNLYQAVKGMSAAGQVAAPEGQIITVARCNDGFPAHGNFTKLLVEHDSPQAILDTILTPGFQMQDQWQAQLFADLLVKYDVSLFSELSEDMVRKAHMTPIENLEQTIKDTIEKLGADTPIAVLPEGPMTIPYLED